jgi:ubiquinone/menaquinone biosynthesis C-methylase UbiE
MLLAGIVGSSGEVVGIERDSRSINRAWIRASESGLRNVTFVQSDIAQFSSDTSFDAAVGRFVLQFLPDPVATLRLLSQGVRPGGVIAFQEQSWKPFLELSRHLPLWSAAVSLLHKVSAQSGVNVELFRCYR